MSAICFQRIIDLAHLPLLWPTANVWLFHLETRDANQSKSPKMRYAYETLARIPRRPMRKEISIEESGSAEQGVLAQTISFKHCSRSHTQPTRTTAVLVRLAVHHHHHRPSVPLPTPLPCPASPPWPNAPFSHIWAPY